VSQTDLRDQRNFQIIAPTEHPVFQGSLVSFPCQVYSEHITWPQKDGLLENDVLEEVAEHCPELRRLDVSECKFSTSAITKLMQKNPSLRRLNMNLNHITDEIGFAIDSTLSSSKRYDPEESLVIQVPPFIALYGPYELLCCSYVVALMYLLRLFWIYKPNLDGGFIVFASGQRILAPHTGALVTSLLLERSNYNIVVMYTYSLPFLGLFEIPSGPGPTRGDGTRPSFRKVSKTI